MRTGRSKALLTMSSDETCASVGDYALAFAACGPDVAIVLAFEREPSNGWRGLASAAM